MNKDCMSNSEFQYVNVETGTGMSSVNEVESQQLLVYLFTVTKPVLLQHGPRGKQLTDKVHR